MAESGRAFWRDVLLAGGATTIPRWTLEPAAGVGEHVATIPELLVSGTRRLADRLEMSFGSVVLAAHAKVLAVLSGESEVVTGYVAEVGGPALPCPLTTAPETWRGLLREAARMEADLRRFRDVPVEELRRALGVAGPAFDPTGGLDTSTVVAGDAVLEVKIADNGNTLRLRYRADVLDAGAAARIAGYHLTALALMVADVDAEHGRQSLLSAGELRFQLDGLAGPCRELPDRRVHELFEQRVRDPPGRRRRRARRPASGPTAELNARANRLGRALLASGLRREGVVAVVTERNLDWMAAVLAIFKAGGVYLPIEPHFPPDRIAKALSRAGCRLVLTEPASTTTLDKALDTLPGVQKLLVDDAYAEPHPDHDLGVAVAADQLAYIYFTSGSTGEPKGAMCEHAGMLNHLHAKIDDLGICAVGRWSPRWRRSVSTSRCGSCWPRCWSAAGPC